MQRASKNITEHMKLDKLIEADYEEMSGMTHDLEGSVMMTTPPVFEDVSGVTVDEDNLKKFNKRFTKKLVANSTASLKKAKDLEQTGVNQMSTSRPFSLILLI